MKIAKKELLHLRVCTRSGMYLGVLDNFVLDTETHTITQYVVRVDWRLAKEVPFFGKKSLVIHRTQVLSMTQKEMIVEDATVPQENGEALRKAYPGIVDAMPL